MKVCICDDSREDLQKYGDIIRSICNKKNIHIEIMLYKSGKKLLFDIEDEEMKPDLVFLEIQMGDGNGKEIAKKLRGSRFQNEIIFLTTSEEQWHMLFGFDIEAMHYVIKDKTTEERFEKIFLRAFEKTRSRKREIINFSCAGESRSISVDDIKYFEVKRKVITVFYKDGSFEFYSTMDKIENMLFNKGFARIHRSYIVSLQYVIAATYDELTLEDGTKIPLGRVYQKEFSKLWKKYQLIKTA